MLGLLTMAISLTVYCASRKCCKERRSTWMRPVYALLHCLCEKAGPATPPPPRHEYSAPPDQNQAIQAIDMQQYNNVPTRPPRAIMYRPDSSGNYAGLVINWMVAQCVRVSWPALKYWISETKGIASAFEWMRKWTMIKNGKCVSIYKNNSWCWWGQTINHLWLNKLIATTLQVLRGTI